VFRFHISLPWVFKGPWLKPRDAKRGKLAQESCYPEEREKEKENEKKT
jgi:hypothetical protein